MVNNTAMAILKTPRIGHSILNMPFIDNKNNNPMKANAIEHIDSQYDNVGLYSTLAPPKFDNISNATFGFTIYPIMLIDHPRNDTMEAEMKMILLPVTVFMRLT
jgi:hypothetical protein